MHDLRTLFMVSMLALLLCASCSERREDPSTEPRDSGAVGTRDSGAMGRPDAAGMMTRDAGTDSGRVLPVDSGPRIDAAVPRTDAGFDAGPPPDAGNDAGTDAGEILCDVAGSGVGCDDPFTNICSGIIEGDTCGGGDNFTLSCGVSGTEDRAISIDQRPRCVNYDFSITSGFIYSMRVSVDTGCPGSALGCGIGFGFTGGCGFRHILVVEKADGTCGPFALSIDRRL